MKHIRLSGNITTATEFATSPAGASSKDKSASTVQVSHVPELNGRLIIPASGFRGALRSEARDLMNVFAQKQTGEEKPFSIQDHFQLGKGFFMTGKKSQEKDNINPTMIEAIYNHNPVYSLFGIYDPFAVPGRLALEMGIAGADVKPMIYMGARRDDLATKPETGSLLSQEAYQDYLLMTDTTELQNEIKALAAQKKEKGADEKALNIKIKSLKAIKPIAIPQTIGFECIPRDTVFDHAMTVRDLGVLSDHARLSQFGFLLNVLSRFAESPYLGARRSLGMGLIKTQWDLKVGKEHMGSIAIEPFEDLRIDDPHGYIAEARAALGEDAEKGTMTWSIQ